MKQLGTLPSQGWGGSAQPQVREGTGLQQDSRTQPAVALGAGGDPRAPETDSQLPRSSPRDGPTDRPRGRMSGQAAFEVGGGDFAPRPT